MFAKHLPPSTAQPRVLALDPLAAAELAEVAEVLHVADPADAPPGPYDAIVGHAAPEALPALGRLLRPGGRLVLAHPAEPQALLAALTQAGYLHCLVESAGPVNLYRGERPPRGSSVERVRGLAAQPSASTASGLSTPYVFLLVRQTPNKPAWKLAPDERLEWRAATVVQPATDQAHLLAFTSLVKAVAFMQAAVLANAIPGVNKVGKFPSAAAAGWELPLLLNPAFDAVRGWRPGPALAVDPQAAITGDE